MRILFVVPYAPNLIRVRPYNLIRSLSARGHEVHVMTLWTDEQERQNVQDLRQIAASVWAVPIAKWQSILNCVISLPSRTPLQAVYSWNPKLARQIEQVTTPSGDLAIDVVHVEHLRGARYGLYLKKYSNPAFHIPVIWDSVDSISLLFRLAAKKSTSLLKRLLMRFELGRTEKFENRLLHVFDHVLVTSENDRKAFLKHSSVETAEVSVIPNGVDLNYFANNEENHREPASLVVTGKMSYHANVAMVLHLVEKIMPVVWEKRPDVKLYIVGKDPTREIKNLSQNPAIEVTGTVPDIRPYLWKATAAVTPISYGVGIQNKVLEAMASGTPVVSTSQAVSALRIKPGEDILVADEPEEFAGSVLRMLNDQTYREKIGRAGRSYVESQHDWLKIAANLETIYTKSILPGGENKRELETTVRIG